MAGCTVSYLVDVHWMGYFSYNDSGDRNDPISNYSGGVLPIQTYNVDVNSSEEVNRYTLLKKLATQNELPEVLQHALTSPLNHCTLDTSKQKLNVWIAIDNTTLHALKTSFEQSCINSILDQLASKTIRFYGDPVKQAEDIDTRQGMMYWKSQGKIREVFLRSL